MTEIQDLLSQEQQQATNQIKKHIRSSQIKDSRSPSPDDINKPLQKTYAEIETEKMMKKIKKYSPGRSLNGIDMAPIDQKITKKLNRSRCNAFGLSLYTAKDLKRSVQDTTHTILKSQGSKLSSRHLFMDTRRGSSLSMR